MENIAQKLQYMSNAVDDIQLAINEMRGQEFRQMMKWSWDIMEIKYGRLQV